MGKKVRYPNGFEGFASDKVAEILEKRGSVEIIGDAKAGEAKPAGSKKGRGKSKDEDEE